MKKLTKRFLPSLTTALQKSALCAVAFCALSMGQANAGTVELIDFEDPAFMANGGLYLSGDTVNSNGFLISTESVDFGLTGLLVDGNDPWACAGMGCPVNNSSNYFAGLNNSWMYFTRETGTVRMQSLDFSFLAPYAGVINGPVGRLVVLALSDIGDLLDLTSKEFAPQENGEWVFSQWTGIDKAFGGEYYSRYAVTACLYTTSGACALDANNQGQFAIDNVSFDVSAPATIGLFSLSLLGLAAGRRRHNKQ